MAISLEKMWYTQKVHFFPKSGHFFCFQKRAREASTPSPCKLGAWYIYINIMYHIYIIYIMYIHRERDIRIFSFRKLCTKLDIDQKSLWNLSIFLVLLILLKPYHVDSMLYLVRFDKYIMKCLYSFFVFSKWSTNTVDKSRLSQAVMISFAIPSKRLSET